MVVRNIVVDGVNFGLTYRNQFQSEMQQSGNNLDHVIANWTKSASK
jgi:phospholipid transport system substrate-binding protein